MACAVLSDDADSPSSAIVEVHYPALIAWDIRRDSTMLIPGAAKALLQRAPPVAGTLPPLALSRTRGGETALRGQLGGDIWHSPGKTSIGRTICNSLPACRDKRRYSARNASTGGSDAAGSSSCGTWPRSANETNRTCGMASR